MNTYHKEVSLYRNRFLFIGIYHWNSTETSFGGWWARKEYSRSLKLDVLGVFLNFLHCNSSKKSILHLDPMRVYTGTVS